MRRAQGLPLNTIIISIIVVVVLVVIILIFTRQMIDNRQTLNSCAVQSGTCMSAAECTRQEGRNRGVLDCQDAGGTNICCVVV
jgi:uncharacterized membrane protein YqiK